MKNFCESTRGKLLTLGIVMALQLIPAMSKAETPLENMKRGRIDSINLPTLVVNDRVYSLAGSVSVRQQGQKVGTGSLSKGQTIAFATGITAAESLVITEIVISPGR